MTKIVKSRSKLSLRYNIDGWMLLLRVIPKLARVTRLFSLHRKNRWRTRFFRRRTWARRLSYYNYNSGRNLKWPRRPPRRNIFFRELSNKKKLRLFYGGLTNRSLKLLCLRASTNTSLLRDSYLFYFEGRLDCLLYRAHFIPHMFYAKQCLRAGVIMVNNKVVTYPSFQLRVGDVISILPGYRKRFYVWIYYNLCSGRIFDWLPPFLEVNYRLLKIVMFRKPRGREVFYPYRQVSPAACMLAYSKWS